ncbi:GroES-like protein [Dothidotthia symphoricarpi CBS 119687]|uniref:alcohol dehydrogenase (NADP(+)) n=1 Tax=Dothidotthia symphoricarpi CBS 119687 TaxID=1392245 RepID=A0A6A6ARA1_9PLEO|nr:GroES-like protein [Dothidotthia symphoricarpi CBS 119687]KAF2133041.1 GroES-like protein [Dothidotthia symphoricarpi CBS 119687]
MTSPAQFHGWLGHDAKAAEGNMTWSPFTPKPFNAIDIDIKISHCGICGSDIHTLRSGWGKTHYPICVGHEVVGHVLRVGSAVTKFQPGDRVGVGAQAFSCLRADCPECTQGLEQHCPKMVGTYGGKHPDGSWSMGGYATHIRVPAHFAIAIPASLPSAAAAPLLCGGITVFAPLRKHRAGPGKRVGIIGIGGLGHMGILFAAALGCSSVVAISRRDDKKDDATAMGATHYIATSTDATWARTHARTLDLLICTVSSPDMPLDSYLRLLRTGGAFVQVGAPEDKLPRVSAFSLIGKGCSISGSQIGSPADIEHMLGFAAEKGVRPWVQERGMGEANKSVVEMEGGGARYRFVLVNDGGERARI